MKLAKPILFLWVLLLALSSCSSTEKAYQERRNLMMPEVTDIKRNSNFKPSKNSYKHKKNKRKVDKKRR